MNNDVYASPDQSYMLNNDIDEKRKVYVVNKPNYGILYSITHTIISFFAIYLSWRCNGGFSLGPFLFALFCPYLYIIYALATHGGCGVFESGNIMSRSIPLNEFMSY
jgi:hypothetical protein